MGIKTFPGDSKSFASWQRDVTPAVGDSLQLASIFRDGGPLVAIRFDTIRGPATYLVADAEALVAALDVVMTEPEPEPEVVATAGASATESDPEPQEDSEDEEDDEEDEEIQESPSGRTRTPVVDAD